MNEDVLNMQLRKFVKTVGVTSQREIERAVREALSAGRITGQETLDVHMTLEIPAVRLTHHIDGTIALND